MYIDLGTGAAGLQLVQRHRSIHNDICRGKRRQIVVLKKRATNAILPLANREHRPGIGQLRNREHSLIRDIGETKFCMNYGIKDNRICTLLIRHPFLRQQVSQQITAARLFQDQFNIITICVFLIIQVWRRHKEYRLVPFSIIYSICIDTIIFLQFQNKIVNFQQILIARTISGLRRNDHRLLQSIRTQVIANINATKYRSIFCGTAELIRKGFLQFFIFLSKNNLGISQRNRCSLYLSTAIDYITHLCGRFRFPLDIGNSNNLADGFSYAFLLRL